MPRFSASLALVLVACSGVASADEVAAVMLVQGDARVRVAGGRETAAQVGVALERGDTVFTAEGAVMVLHLRNNHLVRIDEDLELPLRQLVLIDAPETTLDAREQLEQLLYPHERQGIRGLDQAERVAGWHARLTAAASPAPGSPAAASGDLEEAPSASEVATGGAPPAPPAPRPDTDPSTDDREGTDVAIASGRTRGSSRRDGSSAPAPAGPPAPGRAALEARFTSEGPVRACVNEWADRLPVDIDGIDVTVRLEAGMVERLVFSGGLMPPVCARQALIGATVADVAESSFTFRVSLD